MSTKNIAIAYCTDNEEAVKGIEQKLRPSGYQFQLYPCSRDTSGASLPEQLVEQPNPILLIISDNFLKSAQCMSRGLKLLQEKRTQILPIVVDGAVKDEQSGEWTNIPTDFERVSDIIQYINYWQDRYLDLRRQKRQMKDFDENAFNAHLKVMREISSEAGEFLRVLRGMDYQHYPEFAANSFENFFKFTNDSATWARFKTIAPIEESSPTPPPPPPSEVLTEEEPPAGLSEIPGISLLEVQEQETEPAVEEPAEQQAAEASPMTIEWEAEPQEATEESIPTEPEVEVEPEEAEEAEEPVAEVEADEAAPEEELRDAGDLYNALREEEQEEQAIESQAEEEEEEEDVQVADLVEEALNYFQANRIQEGLAYMVEAMEAHPDDHYLRYHYALMLAQKGQDYPAARQALTPLLEAEGENEDALFLMGELDELLDDFEAAREHYQHLVELNPDYPNAYYRLGMITAGHFEGEKKEAADFFKKAAKLDPANADAYYQYALLLSEAFDKPKKAIKYLKKALEADPHHPFAYYDLALAYHQLGEGEKARKAYAKAIEANPELKTAENDLAFNPPREEALAARTGIGRDTLEALKDNINRLEELLKAREEESLQLKQEMEEKAAAAAQAEAEAIAAAEVIEAKGKPAVDQTVLITGATSGIGKATAELFAQNGYRVIITGRRAARLGELKAQFEEDYDAEILAIEFDVRDERATQEAIGHLSGKWAQIDILINNAGKAKGLAPIHEGKLEHWEEMIDTNIKGLLYMTRAVSPYMVERNSGHIINLCSTAGKEVYPNGNVYCATKFAVDALTKSMRMDLHRYNVRVSMVSPAHVEETEFALVRFDGDEDKAQIYKDFKPLTSRDVAESIFFIATQPPHVNILDIVLQGTQQASSLVIDHSGRDKYEEEE